MRIAKMAFLVVAATGLFSIAAAVVVNHAIYADIQGLRADLQSTERAADAEALSRFADLGCALFGVIGAVQFGVGVIGLTVVRRSQGKP